MDAADRLRREMSDQLATFDLTMMQFRAMDRDWFIGEGRPSQGKGVPIFWDALRGRIVVSSSCG